MDRMRKMSRDKSFFFVYSQYARSSTFYDSAHDPVKIIIIISHTYCRFIAVILKIVKDMRRLDLFLAGY